MEATRPLFLMLSRTGTGIGKTIRLFTRYDYNHVSLSLDPHFRRWVSFARYAQGVPLAGGFVNESPERYFSSGGPIQVKIFRIDIPLERYRKLKVLFSQAGQNECGLIYNTLSALVTPFGLQVPIAGAYTCLEFADTILEESHGSIRALDICHQGQLIYEGDLRDLVSDTGIRNDRFFRHRGFLKGSLDTTWHFARLLGRMPLRHGSDYLSAVLHQPL
ncbi:MAG: hypothetical protein IKJ99_05920 [Oscillospiraceae bacterium]|nr:hypothetical protein [Oscillospiraceae bacterium]